MKLDMHCHTKEGSIDAKVGIESYINKLIALGFDGMLVTDHNSYKGYSKWTRIVDDIKTSKQFKVFKGIEYDTKNGGHFIAILPDDISTRLLEIRGMTVEQLEKMVHGLGGVLGPAHPYGTGFFAFMNTKYGKKNRDYIEKFDFIETFNACTKPVANIMAKTLANTYEKMNIAGSDAHKEKVVGSAFTIFERNIQSNDDLIDAIKEKSKTITGGSVVDAKLKKKNIILEKVEIVGYWGYNKFGTWIRGKSLKRLLDEMFL